MSSPQSTRHTGLTASAPAEAVSDIRALAHELLRRLQRDVRQSERFVPSCGSHSPDSVLLDVAEEGIRCVVICSSRQDAQLSDRQRAISTLVAAGHPNKAIAAALSISPWTVATHLRRIYTKLGVTSRAAMIAALSDPLPPRPCARTRTEGDGRTERRSRTRQRLI
jgi:DNA-binding CsgD family transcriptional regulator